MPDAKRKDREENERGDIMDIKERNWRGGRTSSTGGLMPKWKRESGTWQICPTVFWQSHGHERSGRFPRFPSSI